MKKAEIRANGIVMVYDGEIFVSVKNGKISDVVWEQGAFKIDSSAYDEAYILKRDEINFDLQNEAELLNFISSNKF